MALTNEVVFTGLAILGAIAGIAFLIARKSVVAAGTFVIIALCVFWALSP